MTTPTTESELEHWKNYEVQKPDGSWTTMAAVLEKEKLKAQIETLAKLLNHDNSIYDAHLGQVVSEKVIRREIRQLKKQLEKL